MLKTRIARGTALAAVLAVAGIGLGAGAAFADSTTTTPTIISTITTAAQQNIYVAVSPDGTTGLVTDYQGSGKAYLINLTTHAVIGPVAGISSSLAATFSPDGKTVYVSNDATGQILKVDVATRTITGTLQLPMAPNGNPWKIVLSPDGKTAYATGYHSASLFVFNPATMTNTRTVALPYAAGDGPRGASLSPDGSKIYLAGTGGVRVLSTSTYATLATVPLPTGGQPLDTALSPDGSTLAVTDYLKNTVTLINTATNTVIRTINSAGAFGVAFAPDGKTVYATNIFSKSVSVITAATGAIRTTVTLPAGTFPSGIVASADGKYEYVSNRDGTVTVIANLTAPVVITNPVSATVTAGSTHTFTASCSGVLTPTVQWQTSTDGGNTWTNITGATGTSYTTGALALVQSGTQYRAVCTNASGTATTTPATVTVTVPASPTPTVTTTVTVSPVATPTAVDAGLATPHSHGSTTLTVLGGALVGLAVIGMVLAGGLGRNRRGNHS